MIKAGSKALIGYDIFISYARADARSYAEALNQHLEDLDYSCFLDRNDLSAGQPLAPALKRAIKRSKMFVLLGSKCALESRYVSDEISAFLEGKRKTIIPVDFENALQNAPWPHIRELTWLPETGDAIAAASPSPAILGGIQQSFRFKRRNVIARNAVLAVALFVGALGGQPFGRAGKR
jgi:hypothetical protein